MTDQIIIAPSSPTTSDEDEAAERRRPSTPMASPDVFELNESPGSGEQQHSKFITTTATADNIATAPVFSGSGRNNSNSSNNVSQFSSGQHNHHHDPQNLIPSKTTLKRREKFQFYIPTTSSAHSDFGGGGEDGGGEQPPVRLGSKGSLSSSSSSCRNKKNNHLANSWDSNRSESAAGSISEEIIAEGYNNVVPTSPSKSSSNSNNNLWNSSNNSLPSRGIDPPEKELPTNIANSNSAEPYNISSARSPHRHHPTSYAPIDRRGARKTRQQQKQQKIGQSNHISKSRNNNTISNESNSDDDEDYPLVATAPVESDDDDNDDDRNRRRALSGSPPIHNQNHDNKNKNQSYLNNYPSSAPQPHRLPPEQVMQYLHASSRRDSSGRQQQQGFFPPPLVGQHHQNRPNQPQQQPMQQQQEQQHLRRTPQTTSHHRQQGQQNSYMHRSLQPQQHYNSQQIYADAQPRRKSDDPMRQVYDIMYSDDDGGGAIDILERAANEKNIPPEEADTLNEGIQYLLRNLDEKEKMTNHNHQLEERKSPHHLQQQQRHEQYAPYSPPKNQNMVHQPPPPPPPQLKSQQFTNNQQRPHRPPPPKISDGSSSNINSMEDNNNMQINRTRSNSLGNEMEQMMANMLSMSDDNTRQQHRPPPPPRKPLSNPPSPTRDRVAARPIITAAAAMDYIRSAGQSASLDVDFDDGDNVEEEEHLDDNNKVPSQKFSNKEMAYLKAIMNEKDGDGEDDDEQHEHVLDNSILVDDSSESLGYDTAEDEEFERQSSLVINTDNKYRPSRHAEDKLGFSKSIDGSLDFDDIKQQRRQGSGISKYDMHKSDPSFQLLRKGSKNSNPLLRKGSRDPPSSKVGDSDNDNDDNNDLGEIIDEDLISPSIKPLKTMNEHLYAVEAVIPTPTRYEHEEEEQYITTDDVDTFDQRMPQLTPQDDYENGMSSSRETLLGPRNKRAGGITGVVLDITDNDMKGGYPHEPSLSLNKERMVRRTDDSPSEESSRDGSPSKEESSRSVSRSSSSHHDDDGVEEGEDYNDSQRSAAQHPPDDDHNILDAWTQSLFEGGNPQATSLMLKLCSHLLPIGLDDHQNSNNSSSLNSLLIQNKSMLEWDHEDPDEQGYAVHRLSSAELANVEDAFQKMVNTLERSSLSSYSLNLDARDVSSDKNFERDLEEAEMLLDQEEKRYDLSSPHFVDKSTLPNDDKDGGDVKVNLHHDNKSEQQEYHRETVPDFPGIYPPGKGKAGEMECFYLPIITKSEKTGFEPTKDLVLKPGSVFANNYLVQSELGSAAFSTAYRCLDLSSEEDEDGYQDEVCLKVIKNTKDYFDQSLDEIKILQLLKDTGRVQDNNIVEMKSFFYHREHLVIVTELLRQNLYEFGKSILESRGPLYFTRLRLSHIIRQCLVALKFVHELGLMHCDIKPENILLGSYSRALVKVIDFGSSSFVTDRQSSYIQSRSYRAPEVILGLPYGGKIDIWSLGCVVAEMYTNEVTFQNDSELSMLSRIEAICGPFPRHMIAKGRNSHRIFTDSGLIYEKLASEDQDDEARIDDRSRGSSDDGVDKSLYNVYQPKMTTIAGRLGFEEDFMDQPRLSEDDNNRALFIDFVGKLLTVDPDLRPTATEALKHPWITSSLELNEDDIKYGPERI